VGTASRLRPQVERFWRWFRTLHYGERWLGLSIAINVIFWIFGSLFLVSVAWAKGSILLAAIVTLVVPPGLAGLVMMMQGMRQVFYGWLPTWKRRRYEELQKDSARGTSN
jgi:hypothetical protein